MVLKMYVNDLGDIKAAEDYCADSSSAQETKNKLDILMSIYISQQLLSKKQWRAIRLISNFHQHFDMAKLLQILPGEWKLKDISGLLAAGVSKMEMAATEAVFVRQLLVSRQMQLKCESIAHLKASSAIYLPLDRPKSCTGCKCSILDIKFAIEHGQIYHIGCLP